MDTSSPTPNKKSSPRKRRKAADKLAAIEYLQKDWEIVREEYHDRATVLVFKARTPDKVPVGTAVAVARMSGTDMQNGSTAAAQLNETLAYARSRGLRVGHVIASTDCCGARSYLDRPDMLAIERLVRDGQCTEVIWRETGRVARDHQPFRDHLSVMDATGTRVHFAKDGKVIDPRDGAAQMILGIQISAAVAERASITDRMRDGMWTTCIITGIGSNKTPPFGFSKDADNRLIQCPDTWKWVTLIHYAYAAVKNADDPATEVHRLLRERGVKVTLTQVREILACDTNRAGIRSVCALLEWLGLAHSSCFVNYVLRKDTYATGRHVQVHNGISIELEPIPLVDPVDVETFALNQAKLDEPQGVWTSRRLMQCAISGIVRCGSCGRSMRGIRTRRGVSMLVCPAPPGQCVRFGIDALQLDRSVAEIVRDLDRSDDALATAALAAAPMREAAIAAMERERSALGREERLRELNERHVALTEEITAEWSDTGDFEAYFAAEFAKRGGVALTTEIAQVTRATKAADAIASCPLHRVPEVPVRDRRLEKALRAKLTVGPATTGEAATWRAAIMRDAVSVVVVTVDEDDPTMCRVRVEGALTPLSKDLRYPRPPSVAARESLAQHARTVNASYDYKTVRALVQKLGVSAAIEHMQGEQRVEKVSGGTPDWIVEFTMSAIQRRKSRPKTGES